MELVCETHVWYEIGAGQACPAGWKAAGHRLLASQLTAIELTSKVTPENFPARRAAARAVLDHADGVLTDPERHLASLWGIPVSETTLDRDGGLAAFRALAEAADAEHLRRGVGEMRIDTARAEDWRRGFSEKFRNDITTLIRQVVCPRYATRKDSGRMDYLTGEAERALLRECLKSPTVVESQVLLTRTRAAAHATTVLPAPSPADVDRAGPMVLPYVQAYLKYVERVATVHAPTPNDCVDLLFFVYLQAERVLVTGEKRWLEVAKEAGLEAQVWDFSRLS